MIRTARNCAAAVLVLSIVGCADRQSPADAKSAAKSRTPAEEVGDPRQIVKITPAAIEKLRTAQRKDGKKYLRVAVTSGGTTGFMYDLKFDDVFKHDSDYLHDMDGIKVVVDKRSALFLEGATIDWQTTPDGREGFEFDNPNAVK